MIKNILGKLKSFFSNKIVRIVLIVIVIAGVGFGGYTIYNKMTKAASKTATRELTARVTRGNIDVKLSGTGTVQPISKFDIVPLVKGTIVSAPFSEGDTVKKGDLLYQFDDSSLSADIQKARNSIDEKKLDNQSTTDSINDLQVFAPCDGKISNITLNAGDELSGNNTKIGDIVDDSKLIATIPFTAAQINQIYTDQPAQLIVPQFMTYLDGKVTHVSNASKSGSDGSVLYDVEITINNPGGVTKGTQVNGLVKGSSGDIVSPVSATVENKNEQTVSAKTSGTVKALYVRNNDWVKAGQKIMDLENDSLNTTIRKNSLSLKDQELSLDSQLKKLDDYKVLSPIDGTIITKNYKAGDTLDNGSSNSSGSGSSGNSSTLMTVADMSKMIFNIAVDELDIAKVKVGQKVTVTADALPQEKFEGEITNVPNEGTSSNGVTTYSVQVTIASPGDLKPGMNVNGEIVVESKENVLYLPIAAVTKIGNKAFVTMKDDSTGGANGQSGHPQTSPGAQTNGDQAGNNNRRSQGSNGQNSQNAQRGASGGSQGSTQGNPQGGTQGSPQSGSQSGAPSGAQGSSQGGFSRSSRTDGNAAQMQGRKRQEVVLGVNNDDNIEIVSGLQEGDTVYLPSTAGTSRTTTTPNMMGGGMGMPGGGFGGGAGGAVRMQTGGSNRSSGGGR